MAELSDNAVKVLQRRYLKKDPYGHITETPDDLFRRVARAVAFAEVTWGTQADASQWEESFFHAMHELLFLPNSPTLMNAGTNTSQLSACFVLPVEDRMEDIFTTLKWTALIQQSGGGTGFNFSHLRPKNDFVSGTSGIASGPVSFMKIFDTATEHIKQGGRRRGANMGILNIDHPDIEEFISSKRTENEFRNFNISVGMKDAFMVAVLNNDQWNFIHPNTGKVTGNINARYLWDSLVENAWLSGDPGLIFLDSINATNPTPSFGEMEATNPCGEVPLLPFEACNLGSINLSKFVDVSDFRTPAIDWTKLEETIKLAIRFLDNVIEVNHYIISQTEEIVKGNRKIGLGVMGWAEALSLLGIPYQSELAIDLADRLMKFISAKSMEASAKLSEQRGVFPNWEKSIHYPLVPLRNATLISIAPTGTISILAGTSPSIEPLFALVYQRHHILQDETLNEINPIFLRYLERQGNDADEIIRRISQTGTLEGIPSLPKEGKEIFKTALEITPEWHLRHQSAFQRYTDNAVSKTINLPQQATPSDIDLIYRSAWQQKLKGITVFRNNSRVRQVLRPGIDGYVAGCKVCAV